jgi:ribosomal protein S18 acetylase RimI-like enzyme
MLRSFNVRLSVSSLPDKSGASSVRLRSATVADAPALATLMETEIPWGRLRELGHRFITILHRGLCHSPHAVCTVADVEGRVVGYCAATVHVGRFYRWFAFRYGISAALAILPNLVTRERLITLRKGVSYRRNPGVDGPQAEIAALAVASAFSGRGIGQKLLATTMASLKERGVNAVRVGTVTEGNAPALAVYERYGFRVVRNDSIYGDSQVHVMEFRFDRSGA